MWWFIVAERTEIEPHTNCIGIILCDIQMRDLVLYTSIVHIYYVQVFQTSNCYGMHSLMNWDSILFPAISF